MKKKILVVDDEPGFLRIITLRLQAENYDVVTASNGEEALDVLKKEKPNAVLLDIAMPKLDGLEALKRIRKRDKNLPVFMITAYSNIERFKEANRLKASGYIVKTDNLKQQLENVTTAINIADKYRSKR